MLIFVVNIRPARTFWNCTHCLLSPFTLDWSRNLLHNPMWNMAVNNISYSIYLLSTKIENGYTTKGIPIFFCSVYNETKFLSCHIPYTNNILRPVSSYYFLSHKKRFQAGICNVNVRPDLLYFSIWGIYSKHTKNITYGRWKQLKFCASTRLVWWNVIYSTKSSVVLLALKAKGPKILNAPRITTCYDKDRISPWIWLRVSQQWLFFVIFSGIYQN